MNTPLTLTPGTRPDGTARLTVAGEIDLSNSADFARAVEATEGRLLVDLTAVDYLDSAALAVLFTHADRLELVVRPLLMPLLTISGLTDLTTVHTTTPDSAHP
ncbi:anti-anti-sigma factor [Saccharothrix tamanrassetensis]|uniref:Anti-anti-sigma factor n=1 Tax=Saccharothrix tamanrassetensis TaxID=1051531 RepID=A0A841CMB4_9PSEU|nr:STAS domain-containing protein [Saccharothrix tamanrassetensis]MBB5957288.1 anti-anti-sigma factor [Saccharothrix tamanrassetensis]